MPRTPLPPYNSMIASARIIPPDRRFAPRYQTWQEQAWAYYDQLGEFESAVSWRANTLSRVRLVAAQVELGGDEPTPLIDGPAAEAVGRLGGGTAGQSQIMAEITAHLTVVGECWVVGETNPDDGTDGAWSVRSANELRVARGPGRGYQIRDDDKDTSWRDIDAIVTRVWDPHPRWSYQADPASRHAFSAMTKLDLANKRVIATTISRLASNGILLYDKERLSLHTTSQTQAAGIPGDPSALTAGGDEPDPFAAMLVDVASRGIKDPTAPEAVIPIPIGYSIGQDLANINPALLLQHITFASDVDERLLAQRQDALRELATALDLPVEALIGIGDLNHWSAWAIEESGIKLHVAPTAELICHALTVGYLRPYLKAAGEDTEGFIVWYDPTELTLRPDRSANTIIAYDKLEANGAALRRETGLDEDDKPTTADLKDMILKKQASMESLSPTALAELTGVQESTPEEPGTAEEPEEAGTPANGAPGTLEEPAPAETTEPGAPTQASLSALPMAELHALAAAVEAAITDRSPPRSAWVDPLTPVARRDRGR